MSKINLDWNNLQFNFIKTDYSFIMEYKNGNWQQGKLVTENTLTISAASTSLHYGQQCFEGLKAYRCKDGSINLFRIKENAKRLNQSCDRLLMPNIPEDLFIESIKTIVKANENWIPPYGSGGTLYIRPYVIGVGDNIGVKTSEEFIFGIFVIPVGNYFKGGLKPSKFLVSKYDRAAPLGTGAAKVGGNYAASLLPGKEAKEKGFADAIYLDPLTHTKIEEVGAANFFGITHDDEFITPISPSILASITKYSLLYLAEHRLKLKVSEKDVFVDQLDIFKEAGACGTAAVITPISLIQNQDKIYHFYSDVEVGPITSKLYKELVGIQFGEIEAPEDWIIKI